MFNCCSLPFTDLLTVINITINDTTCMSYIFTVMYPFIYIYVYIYITYVRLWDVSGDISVILTAL